MSDVPRHLWMTGDSHAADPYLERGVTIQTATKAHHVSYRTFRNTANEVLLLNGEPIAWWRSDRSDPDDTTVSEWFAELTGLFPHCWDEEFQREGWPAYEGPDWYWNHLASVARQVKANIAAGRVNYEDMIWDEDADKDDPLFEDEEDVLYDE